MRQFVTSYYATVTQDPATSWEQLTPAFQASAGSYENYTGYWSTIAEVRIRDVVADPATLTVTFESESERADGSEAEEVVTLQLQRAGDGYLIAGQS